MVATQREHLSNWLDCVKGLLYGPKRAYKTEAVFPMLELI